MANLLGRARNMGVNISPMQTANKAKEATRNCPNALVISIDSAAKLGIFTYCSKYKHPVPAAHCDMKWSVQSGLSNGGENNMQASCAKKGPRRNSLLSPLRCRSHGTIKTGQVMDPLLLRIHDGLAVHTPTCAFHFSICVWHSWAMGVWCVGI